MPTDTPALARFGHHPDPAIDFCVEVEEIDAIHYDVRTGIAKDKEDERNRRISRAMSFRVGGDEKAVAAKDRLRVIEREAAPPNPVAEVVERLRRDAYAPPFTSVGAANLMIEAADLIERLSRERDTALAIERDPTSSARVCALMDAQYMAGAQAAWNASQSEDPEAAYAALGKSREGYVKILIETRSPAVSRERDTGVPEGWRLVPMIGAEVRADHPITSLNPDPTFEVFAIRAEADQRLYVRGENTCWFNIDGIAPAAAPQPPTVSTQGWQDKTGEAPRDWVIRKNGYFYRANRSGYTQEIVAAGLYTEAEAKAEARIEGITAHRASEFIADMPDIVSTLTRERDQAREALAPFAKVLDAMEHDNQLCEEEIDSVLAGTGIVPSDLRRARSVLHPDTEVSS